MCPLKSVPCTSIDRITYIVLHAQPRNGKYTLSVKFRNQQWVNNGVYKRISNTDGNVVGATLIDRTVGIIVSQVHPRPVTRKYTSSNLPVYKKLRKRNVVISGDS